MLAQHRYGIPVEHYAAVLAAQPPWGRKPGIHPPRRAWSVHFTADKRQTAKQRTERLGMARPAHAPAPWPGLACPVFTAPCPQEWRGVWECDGNAV